MWNSAYYETDSRSTKIQHNRNLTSVYTKRMQQVFNNVKTRVTQQIIPHVTTKQDFLYKVNSIKWKKLNQKWTVNESNKFKKVILARFFL